MAIIPAFTINGFTRPELHTDTAGNIVLDPVAASFAATYGIKALYLGVPAGTPYPPVPASLTSPSDTNNTANLVAEGAANGTAVGLTALATNTSGQPVSYTLTENAGGRFAINSTTGVVTVANGSLIDFENNPSHSYSITVQANDGSLTTSRSFTIGVSDVAPSTPADVNGTANTVAEGAANGTTVGVTLAATDVNGGAITYSLTDNANGAFAINSTTGVITVADSTKIDFETAVGHAYTVTARASDGTLFSNTQTFTIGVSDVAPLAPSDTNGATNTVAEGAANGSTVGITASSLDPNGPATTYSLTDSAGGRFTIDSSTGVVTVANGAAIDFETAAGHAYGIIVQATNGALSTSSAFSIGVTDVGPSVPNDTDGAPSTVFEGAANGTTVGITVSSTDPGGGPAPTYSLTDSAGGRFAIDPTTGIVTVANGAAIDFETAAGHAYGITVQTQAGALTNSQNFSIGVADVNEAPAGTDKAVLIAEDTTYTFGVADFGFTDPSDSSAPNSLLAVRITTVPGAGEGTLRNNGVTVNAGVSVLASDIAAGHLVFTPVLDANGSPEATFTFQVQDNGGTANGGVDLDQFANTFTINVNAGNDAPINSVPGTQSVNEGATLSFSTGNGNAITISDVDVGSGDETVTLTVASGTLALGSTAGLTSFTNNAASITLTGTVANVNAALNGLTYTGNLNFNGADSLVVSTSDNGNTGTGGPQNDTDSITINVAPVNDAPVNSVPGAQTVNEDTNLVFTGANAITISDVDGGSGDETVTLTVAGGTLALGSTLNLTSFTNNAASITLTGTIANINAALDGLTYHGNLNFNGADSLSIVTHDNGNTGGGDLTDTDSVTINVTAVNDAPVVTAGHTLNYTENQAATAIDPAITVSDVDSANLASATVQITANYVNGEDLLGFTNQNGITGSYNAATGTLTLTGSSSVANYQTALASVTYVNTSDNPSAAARTVTIITNDGAANSVATTDTISVAPVNDAPVVTAGHTLNYTENQGAAAIDPAITLSDVDSANLVSATVQISGNYVVGEDVLAFTDQNGITGSFNVIFGTLTLTGSSSVANYQAALASVTYLNTSENPLSAARTVTIITNDGAASSVAATDTIHVTPVNDAPTATNLSQSLVINEDDAATTLFTAAPVVADIDSASVTATLTLDAAAGTLNNAGVGVLAAGVLTYTITGTAAQVNGVLASVTYDSAQDFFGTSSVGVTIGDGANGPQGSNPTGTVGITVNPVNDAPTLTAAGNNPAYTATPVDLFSTVSASTVEGGQLIDQLVLTVTNISGTATDSLTIDGTLIALTDGNNLSTATPGVTASVVVLGNTATVTITSTPGLSGTDMAALVEGLIYTDTNVHPGDPARVVTITSMHDTGGTTPGVDTATLNITSTVNFDIAPTVTAGHTLNYTENQAATVFDPAITVTDPDNANLASATVQISANYVNGEDVLGFTSQNGITGSFNAATGTLTLTGSSTVAHYQTALASVTYVNTSDNPSGAARTVTITTNDGILNSAPVTDTINVTPVNDAPVAVAGHTLAYTENQAATAIDPAIAVSDVDNANLASATVQISANYVNGQDVLGFTTQNGITGSFNAANGTLTLTGSSSVANYQAALASVTYVNTSDNPSGAARTVTIITNDGTANSVAVIDTINVTPVNDAPVSTAGGTLNYTENQAATAIDSSVTLSDVDNTNLSSATVQISGNYANGQDILGFTSQNGITGSFNAATGTLTLSGSSSVANYQAALHSVTYFNNSDNPSGLDRTVTYTASDGALNSNSSTSTIHVTPVNDAPVVSAGATATYTENLAAASVAGSLTLADADNTSLGGAIVSLTNAQANDVLSVQGQAGTSGDLASGIHFVVDNSAHTVTFSNTDTVTDYQAALRLVQFSNTSEDPSTTARSFTVTADDGQAVNHSGSTTTTLAVVAVDDAPVNTVPADNAVPTAFSNTNTAISGISVFDVDAQAGPITTQLSVTHGTVAVTLAGGATISAGVNGSATLTLSGTPAAINATLANNVVFHSTDGYTGQADLTVVTNDQGHTGTGGPLSDTDVVHIGVVPQVWYIDNTNFASQGAGGSGTAADPFRSIADFNGSAGPGQNDYVVIETGTGTYSGAGLNLQDGQQVYGAGETLSFTNPVTTASVTVLDGTGTRPTINVTTNGDQGIDLASNNTIHGVNITTAAGTTGLDDGVGGTANAVGSLNVSHMAISGAGQAVDIGAGGTLNVTLESAASTGGTNGISLTSTSGTFHSQGGTLSGASGADVALNGGTVNFTNDGAINDATGTVVSIANMTGGTQDFNGSITGGSIALSSNAGATMRFDGGMTLSTGASDAFSATGGGTVNVTGSSNSITTTTGIALNVSNTTIGASEVTFHDISSNGASSGIILNNTGTSGGLNVTGNNTTARDGSGGTITGSTGNGVSLTNTSQVSLQHMNINNSATNGIAGSQVNGFVSDWNSLSNNGTAVNEGGIRFGTGIDGDPTGLTGGAIGSATETRIDHTVISGSWEHGLVVENTSGTLTQLNLTGTTIQNDLNGSGFLIETRGPAGSTAAATVQIAGSSFLNNPGAGVQGDALRNTTLTMNILGNTAAGTNTFTGHDTILLGNGDTGHLIADIRNNTISGNGNGIFVGNAVSATAGATLSAKIVGNNVTTNAGGANHSISSLMSGGTSHLLIDSNTVVNNGQVNGINIGTPDDPSGPNFTAIVTNNTVTNGASAANGISLSADVTGPGATAVFKVEGNTVNWSAPSVNNLDGIFLNQFGTSTVALERGGSASNTASIVLAANNPNAHANGVGGAATTASGTITVVSNGTITLPLLAALGGVAAATPAQAASTGDYHLTQAELDSVVAAAIAQWAAAGASASQLAALHATTFSVADLSDNTIGEESLPSHITIDVDAAGHGWFVDPTPSNNSEFTHAANAAGTDLFTDPSNAAAGHLDLLTTVTHEMGHVLGLPDLTSAHDVNDLMYIDLVDGERRLPDATDVAQANAPGALQAEAALPLSAQAAVGTPIVVGTAANDTIDAGHGGKILVGGAGADSFVFASVEIHAATPWSLISALLGAPPVTPPALTHVADYSFAQGDSFDFSALTSAFHGSLASDAQIVRAVEDPSGTFATLQVNASGPGGAIGSWLNPQGNASWVNIAQLDGAHAGDNVSVLIDSHTVHLAQIHVGLLA